MSDTEQRMRERARQRLRESIKAQQETPAGSPLGDDQVVSDAAKARLKQAGGIAEMAAKWTADKVVAATGTAWEKAKEAKAHLDAKREKDSEEQPAIEATSRVIDTSVESPVERVEEAVTDPDLSLEPSVDASPGVLVAEEVLTDPAELKQAEEINVPSQEDGVAPTDDQAQLEVAGSLSGSPPEKVESEQTVALVEVVPVVGAAPVAQEADAPRFVTPARAMNDAVEECVTVASPAQSATTFQWRRPWIVGSVLVAALGVGAFLFLSGKEAQPEPTGSASTAEVAATPAAPERSAEVKPAVPAPAPFEATVQSTPALQVEEPEKAPAPTQVAVAAVRSQTTPPTQRQKGSTPKKASVPEGANKNEWQQKANADLDAWAKKSGIE